MMKKIIVNQVSYDNYALDRDIPDKLWDNYLKKYNKKYVMFINEDRCWAIKCWRGSIEPYSIKNGLLMFSAQYKTPYKKTLICKKLEASGVKVTQEGHDELVAKFEESQLSALLTLLRVKKKRKLSLAHKKKSVETLKKARALKNKK